MHIAELAESVFRIASATFLSGSKRIDFVTDQYPPVSIKCCECDRRAIFGILKVHIVHHLQKCPWQWKKYLSVDFNKVELVGFLVQEMNGIPQCAQHLQSRLFMLLMEHSFDQHRQHEC